MPISKLKNTPAFLRIKTPWLWLIGLSLIVATAQTKAEEQVFHSNGEMSVFVDRDAELRALIYWPGSEPGSTAGRARFVL